VSMPASARLAATGVMAEAPARRGINRADGYTFTAGHNFDSYLIGAFTALDGGDFDLIAVYAIGVDVAIDVFDFDYLIGGQLARPVKLSIISASEGGAKQRCDQNQECGGDFAANHRHSSLSSLHRRIRKQYVNGSKASHWWIVACAR